MTLNEAIRDLSLQHILRIREKNFYQADCLQLGIEALRRIKYTRYDPAKDPKALLPGETEAKPVRRGLPLGGINLALEGDPK